ncbi:tail fiber domain-containing protein [Enterobacter phage Entb_43]|nr:tail fiber domain-containing protein [Enterobacter phage Entb_43]
MATIKQIQFKRSNVAGKRPLPADIAEGELAINIKDSTLFTKNADGQIIDLGFAKGGKIDGDVTQVGNYTQTGNYTTSGDISAKTLLVSSGVESQGDIRANSGVFRTRANAASNAHLWFEGIEVGTGKNFERGVMYAPPQQANAGAINLRVLNGTATDSGQALFSWRGDGDFNIPRDFLGQRARLAIEAVAPTFNGGRLYTRDRTWNQFGTNESYGWNDLVGYTVGQNGALALNYVYKGRAHVSGTIWHHLIDEREAPEWALYTGSGPTNKMFALRSVGTLGHAQFTGSLFLGSGSSGTGFVSGMGEGSLALGDNDTGFRNDGDGAFSVMGNSRALVHYNASAPKFQIEHRKATRITHTDNSNATILPSNNTSILEVDTSLDGNNVGGNGLTLLGYVSSGRYYHYFRGTGGASFDMDSGVNITKGGLTVVGGAYINGSVGSNGQFKTSANDGLKIWNGDYGMILRRSENNFYLIPTAQGQAENGGIGNLRPFFIDCATGNVSMNHNVTIGGQSTLNGNVTLGSGNITLLGGSGNIGFAKAGTSPYSMRIFYAGNSERGNRIEFADDSSYLMYIERHPSVGIQLVTNGGHIKTNAGSVYTEAIALNSGARFVADGNIYLPNATNGFSAGWLLGQINSRINGVNDNANNRVAKSGDTMTGTLTINNGANTGVMVSGITSGSDKGLIRGNVDGGAHTAWENRSSGLQLDCPNSDGSAYNVWKATKWGAYHIAAMDVYAPSGNGYVRLVIRNGGAHIWNNSSYTSPVQINAPEFYLTSDISLKKDIRSIEDSRSNLHKVEIKRYAMKDGSNDNAIGVIAQEVQKVYPELVSENKDDGKLSVNYRGLSSVLWKIVQEQDKELEDVKSRLARIEELLSK